MKKIAILLFDKVFFYLFKQNLNDNSSIYVVSGSPRSGTTYLAEILANNLPKSLIVWEPLQNKMLRKIDVNILRPVLNDINGNLQNYLDSLTSLQSLSYYNTWTRNFNYLKNLIRGNHQNVIIKFTRGNGILDFYYQYKQVKAILVIVRNPFSVVASQIEHHEFDGHPIISVSSKHALNFKRVGDKFAKDPATKLALSWANDYLNAKNNTKSILLIYDKLIKSPEELKKHIPMLKLPLIVSKSSTTNKKTIDYGSYTSKWKKTLREKDVMKMKSLFIELDLWGSICEDFDITL